MTTPSASPWHALSDPMRRKVLARIARGPCSVTEIANDLPVSRPAVSQHLRVLLDAQLVDVRQQGRMRVYEIRTNGVELLRQELDLLLAHKITP